MNRELLSDYVHDSIVMDGGNIYMAEAIRRKIAVLEKKLRCLRQKILRLDIHTLSDLNLGDLKIGD